MNFIELGWNYLDFSNSTNEWTKFIQIIVERIKSNFRNNIGIKFEIWQKMLAL